MSVTAADKHFPTHDQEIREHIAQEIAAMWRPIGVHLADPADAWDAARESAATVARGGAR